MSPFDKAWSPYVAGILIGLLQIPAFLIIETALGASSSYVTVGAGIAGLFDPSLLNIDYVARHVAANAKNLWQVALVAGIALRRLCVDEDVGRGARRRSRQSGRGRSAHRRRVALRRRVCRRVPDAVRRTNCRRLHQRPRPVGNGAIIRRLDGRGCRDVRRRYRYRFASASSNLTRRRSCRLRLELSAAF